LTEQYEKGLSASAIGTHRSALSIFLSKVEGYSIGEHPLVCRFMKGIKNIRPALPRYKSTWDCNIVIDYLRLNISNSLKALTLKLTMLLALTTAQRAQTISKLKISDMQIYKDRIIVRISEALKTRAAGTGVVELHQYENPQLCVFSLVQEYIHKTAGIRNGQDNLILSFVKPHKVATVDSIRRYILTVMNLSGIDVSVYKPHSTRGASTSKAWGKGVPTADIMKVGMWQNAETFAKFYRREVEEKGDSNFQHAVLDN